LPRVSTRIRGLDLIGANKALGLAGALEPAGDEATARLAHSLDALFEAEDYDLLLIDAPPSFGPLTLNVLRAVREVVIPVPLTFLGLDGCAALLRTIETVRTRYGNPALRITMVIPTFYRRTRMAHELLERLKARFPKELAHTVLGYHVKIDEAQSRGQSVIEYAPSDRASKAFAALAEELELRAPETGGAT
jgi:chromosome partitioning protein